MPRFLEASLISAQHENAGGCVNINWSPGFVAMAAAECGATGGVTYRDLVKNHYSNFPRQYQWLSVKPHC